MKLEAYPHRYFIVSSLVFLLGVWVGARGFSLSSFFLGLLWFYFYSRFSWDKRWVFFMVFSFAFGFLRIFFALPLFTSSDLAYYNDVLPIMILEGVIVDFPDSRSNQIRLTLRIDRLSDSSDFSAMHTVDGLLLSTLSRYPEYSYGDRLRLTGSLRSPPSFEDFSYDRYLQRYGIHSVLYSPKVEVLQHATLHDTKWLLFLLKSNLESRLNQLFSEPHASFAAGLLLGSRRGIPPDLMDAFNQSGLTHIIAISGYNITLIIACMLSLLRGLSRRVQIVISSATIFIFVILVGATSAVIRASVMGVIALWALGLGRSATIDRMLVFAALIMTVWNPFILVDDVGFQLSFIATCGLIYVNPFMERLLQALSIYQRLPSFFAFRESFVTTLSAQLLSFPLLVIYFHRFSIIAPLANALISPFIPLAMLTSFLALIFSYFWQGLGVILAYISWFFLEWIIQVARYCAELPFSSLDF
ncbi:MAG: hypothetical protein ACD_28C00409G0004 [uncultured bacterium]|nr:MAG: hypothetical protein ACD_28C00409G0004 [uncultured bacterium]KKT76548.1 MAG: Competence protein ComEC [Candidatus Peregrinibacteria bacterium GW2011_GWA2_44_7]